MKAPPLLIGAALVFWGWQSGHPAMGGMLAVIIEAARFSPWRMNLGAKDFNRISDLSALAFVSAAAFTWATDSGSPALMAAPTLFPLAAAQILGSRNGVSTGAIFYTARIRIRKGAPDRSLDITFPYLAVVLLSTSAANQRTPWFYAGVFVFIGWSLWSIRPRRYSWILWAGLILTAGLIGLVGHTGLHLLHLHLESRYFDWIVDRISSKDPYRNTTALGEIGLLKTSDQILFRVKPPPQGPVPSLLRQASYNLFRSPTWLALQPGFENLRPERGGQTWRIGSFQGTGRTLTVFDYLEEDKGLLKLPPGAFQVSKLPVAQAMRNQLGAVKIQGGPPLLAYRVSFDDRASRDAPPTVTDLTIPDSIEGTMRQTIRALGPLPENPEEKVRGLIRYFHQNFSYSLDLETRVKVPPLEDFLLHTKTGHCEYFATAAVMTLRAMGIPARYATGFLVDEYSSLEGLFVIRARHAHAWALAHIGGRWRDVDATPPNWAAFESGEAPGFGPVWDLFRWLGFRFSLWRTHTSPDTMTRILAGLLISLVMGLVLKIFIRKKIWNRRIGSGAPKTREPTIQVLSPFREVEARLTSLGFPRNPSEPLSSWITRLRSGPATQMLDEDLDRMLALHYRLRYDPRGLTAEEKTDLKKAVVRWLKKAHGFEENLAPRPSAPPGEKSEPAKPDDSPGPSLPR